MLGGGGGLAPVPEKSKYMLKSRVSSDVVKSAQVYK